MTWVWERRKRKHQVQSLICSGLCSPDQEKQCATYRISFLAPGTHFKIVIDKAVHAEEEDRDGKRYSEIKELFLDPLIEGQIFFILQHQRALQRPMDKKVWKPQKGKLLVKYKAKHNQPLKRYLELTLPTKNRGEKSKRKIEKKTNERKIIQP